MKNNAFQSRSTKVNITIRDAIQRYLRRRSADAAESSIKAWKYRLKLFAEWAEGVDCGYARDLDPILLDEYFEIRASAVTPATLEGEMWTLKKFVEYLEQLDLVEDGLTDSVRIPDLDKEDRTDDTTYPYKEAYPQLSYYRNSLELRASREHAFLELLWYTGARQGGIRGLDVRDFDPDRESVEFHHRPDTGTTLKNKTRGERPVALPPEPKAVVREYIDKNRYSIHDDHGRQPLLASAEGRPGTNTLRVWSYLATLPCVREPCPHGKTRDTCIWTEYAHCSKCPSSRSPHKIRSGSITWQLNRGIPPEVVAERVNASKDVIYDHYDWATQRQRWDRFRENMKRRRHHVEKLQLGDNDD